jgi:hypothetical protein
LNAEVSGGSETRCTGYNDKGIGNPPGKGGKAMKVFIKETGEIRDLTALDDDGMDYIPEP